MTEAQGQSVTAKDILEGIGVGTDLGEERLSQFFAAVMAGEIQDIELAAILGALKARGETPAELAGAAKALREAATPFPWTEMSADCCGTGGDGAGTVNISTAAALVAAEAGVTVAKHGNRSVSSRCGSADVLEQCGLKLDIEPALAAEMLAEERYCFLYAPLYHRGMRFAMPVRRALRTRTLFNLLGPLVNPARPQVQLMGVYDVRWLEPLAQTLKRLGCQRALVVHGSGLDEVALHGPTDYCHLHHGEMERGRIEPEELGCQRRDLSELSGGGPEENKQWLQDTLAGRGGAASNHAIALNAGALLWLTEQAPEWSAGVARALEILASGRSWQRFERCARLSHGS